MDCYCVSLSSYVHAPRLVHGKRDECLICKVACRTILLSKHTDSDIQALFMGIDSLCRKYAKETSQISEFQEKHRRRLLAFYGEKISQLEESLRKSTLRVEQLQRVRSSQQAVFSTVKTPASTPSARPDGPLLQSRDSSTSERVESMEVDLTPSPRRKPEVAAGPPRISLLSPPRDGRMGSIAHRPQHLGLTPRCSSEPQTLRACQPWGTCARVRAGSSRLGVCGGLVHDSSLTPVWVSGVPAHLFLTERLGHKSE
ncbi:probable E3 SUMO-protein ligase RNF212 isoform X2 [Muntiacus reevesi]|uniref:probable E3 SUMO-protein ligase RNF212 isoform X2 n=1 Tax=Muntiacus reevesi TaxID=9886 RepID=UPI003306A4C6